MATGKAPGERQPLPVGPPGAPAPPGSQESPKRFPGPGAPPSFVEEPTPRQLSPNEVVFQGRVKGNPLPEVKWAVYNRPLAPGKDVETSLSPDGVFYLRLINIQPHDAGRYTCTAINEYGQAISTSVLYLKGEICENESSW